MQSRSSLWSQEGSSSSRSRSWNSKLNGILFKDFTIANIFEAYWFESFATSLVRIEWLILQQLLIQVSGPIQPLNVGLMVIVSAHRFFDYPTHYFIFTFVWLLHNPDEIFSGLLHREGASAQTHFRRANHYQGTKAYNFRQGLLFAVDNTQASDNYRYKTNAHLLSRLLLHLVARNKLVVLLG